MSGSVFQQFFDNFEGVDLLSSDLSRSDTSAKVLQNCTYLNNKTLGKRQGVVGVGAPGQFAAIKKYIYRDSDTGLDQEKLIGIKATGCFSLESATTSFDLDTAHVINYRWEDGRLVFRYIDTINNQVVDTLSLLPVSNFTNSISKYGTIYDLLNWISGLSGASVTAWPHEGGVTTSTYSGTSIPVAAISTLADDAVICVLTVNGSGDPILIHNRGYRSSSTLFEAEEYCILENNHELGSWASPVTSIVDFGESGLLAENFSFYYWKPIIFCVYDDIWNSPFPGLTLYPSIANKVSAARANDSLYICSTPAPLTNADKLERGNYNYLGTASSTFSSKLFKYDGKNLYRAGAPFCAASIADDSGGTGVPAGTYRYAIAYVMKDYNGYETWGNIDYKDFTHVSAKDVNITLRDGDDDKGFNSKGGIILTGGTGTSFYVEIESPQQKFQPGDWFGYAHNSAVGASELTWVRVASVNYTPYTSGSYTNGYQVTLESSITIANNSYVTGGAYCRVYRTVSQGLTYYKVGEQVIGWNLTTDPVLKDTISNTSIIANEILIEPPKGKTWNGGDIAKGGSYNGPTNCSIVASHQGALVISGDPINPNVVITSEPGDIEYFPLAYNTVETPSDTGGAITCIESQTDDVLLVFKNTAIYEVAGDIANQAYSIRTLTTNDYGVAGVGSVARFKNISVCANENGIYAIAGGALDTSFAEKINPLIRKKDFAYSCTQITNDYTNQLLIFCFLREDFDKGDVVTGRGNDIPVILVYDYIRGTWGTFSYPHYKPGTYADDFWCMNPTGGTEIVNRNKYHLSLYRSTTGSNNSFGVLYRSLPDSCGYLVASDVNDTSLERNFCYYDDGLGITQTYKTNWLNLGEPGLEKQAIRHSFYSVRDAGDTAYSNLSTYPRTPQYNTVNLYKNWIEDFYEYTKNIVVPEANTRFFREDFKGGADKYRSMMLEFVNDEEGQSMQLTGHTIVWKASYKKEDVNG